MALPVSFQKNLDALSEKSGKFEVSSHPPQPVSARNSFILKTQRVWCPNGTARAL